MDYWIGDDVVTPEWMSEQFSEIVWRLPRSWVSYADGDAVAPVGDADDAHPLTLGSFNSLKKLTPDTVALWARCLHALPGAELFLKTKQISDPAQRRRVEDSFAAQGVDVARLRLDDGADTHARADHLAAYRRMDVALDPIGAMGGATTTCDALWMGVPVVTLAGSVPGARMSASMLHGAGHPGWVASDANEYVTKVCQLARDAGLRRSLRCDLRDQVRSQPLGDAAGLATALEDAFEEMFARWKH
jgi:predicted O-linked N-acetylglucosamine transferase (SPINDLY family)